MELIAVQSKMLAAVGFDEALGELEAVFHDGAIWRYRNVERDVFEELLAAESKGHYMQDNIIPIYEQYRVRRRP